MLKLKDKIYKFYEFFDTILFFRWENKIFFGRGLVRCLKF
ncbi:Not available [Clostridium perfringens]|nr:Not available [Clostridium perfringens]